MVNFKVLERDIKFYNIKANAHLNKTILDDIKPNERKSLMIEREKLHIKILDSKCGINPDKLVTDIRNKRAVNASEVIINKIIGGNRR